MRPVLRGLSPREIDFENYRDAFVDLLSRMGPFCSYCERRINTQLAVEHIQPKALPAYSHLEGRWDNFLLGCVNCNSTKSDKDVVLAEVMLPDRDNTAAAFTYHEDGRISINADLTQRQQMLAESILELTGLNKRPQDIFDANERLVATERFSQRKEAWLIALMSKDDLSQNPTEAFRRQIARTASSHGFFSIWMSVFEEELQVRRLLIQEFNGTAIDCFDANTTAYVIPRPNTGLPDGGKL
jgi:uncharacterized protein (TIGR02646 family)